MGAALEAIERAVAAVADPTDAAQRDAALRTVSPAMVDDVVFGPAAGDLGAAADGELVVVGVGVSAGTAVGVVCASVDAVLDLAEEGRDAVLVVDETSPAHEAAMRLACAVVTRRGGRSSHAAIVARHLGLPAVCGVGDVDLVAGEAVLVDGTTGEVRRWPPDWRGPAGRPLDALPGALATLLAWADRAATVRVLANADRPEEATRAARLGAAGIGLCRVERRLADLGPQRFRDVVVGVEDADVELASALASSWEAIGRAVGEGAVRVRLLDASPHQLGVVGIDGTIVPESGVLGVRGVRLGLLAEPLVRAQARAAAVTARRIGPVRLALTVPLVSHRDELRIVRSWIDDELAEVGLEQGDASSPAVAVGAMVETPRAALVAGTLAPMVDHLSIGTNDLTQLTYGLSRDEAHGALGHAYEQYGIWERNPFDTLDVDGVVRLVALAVETARAANPDVRISLCGAHAADPASIAVAARLGVHELSVPPYQVPATRLAVAHVAIGGTG